MSFRQCLCTERLELVGLASVEGHKNAPLSTGHAGASRTPLIFKLREDLLPCPPCS